MLPENLHWIIEAFEPEGDPWLLLQVARELEAEGNLEGAAAVYDRAYGVEPGAAKIRQARAALLDRLLVREHGLTFRYVPGGPFLMGSTDGEDDEKPLHPVWLAPYWLSETTVSWADYCRLMSWPAPPETRPDTVVGPWTPWDLQREDQLRRVYSAEEVGGTPRRSLRGGRGRRPSSVRYDTKPMVCVGWQAAEELCGRLTRGEVRYALPTEAQWEKAARGGLIGARYAWGDEPPSAQNCDFDRFHVSEIRPSKTFPANGYGLYAMCGGVWEWTADWYDREYYRHAQANEPRGPETGEEKVLRGGSWADCAEVVTVSYRASRRGSHWRGGEAGGETNAPNHGFRLCREVVGRQWS